MSASYLLLSTLLAVCFLFHGVAAQCSSSSQTTTFNTNTQYTVDVASTPTGNSDVVQYSFDQTTSSDCSVDSGSGPVGYGQDEVKITCTATGSKHLEIVHADNSGPLGTCDFFFTVQSSSVQITLTHSQVDIPCHGYGGVGSATVVASGSSGYSYSWVDSNNNPMPSSTATLPGISAGTYTVTVSATGATSATHTFTITEPAALTATTSMVSDITCHGAANGAATVTVSGGTTPYTYLWSNNDATASTTTPLGPGSYTVTVSDAHSCPMSVAAASVTITDPATFTATTSIVSDITCHNSANGVATVSATGGTAPYTYLWNNNDATATTTTPLTAGSYTVTVTDSRSCSPSVTPSSVTITNPAALSATIPTFTHNTCPSGTSGTASLSTITGGTSPYQILWTPTSATTQGITGLAAGVYTATITDAHSCTVSPSVTINSPGSFVITPSHTNVNCPGGNDGTATVTVTGGSPPYTYLWSSGDTTQTATGLIAGAYTVTITDNGGCSATSATITVSAPAAFVTTPSHTDVSCHGGTNGAASVAITGGTAPYFYSWSTGSSTPGLSNIGGGTYSVQLHDNNNCPIPSVSITVNDPPQLTATLNVNDITCHGGTGSATLTVTGGTGAKTYTWSNSVASSSSATATSLAAGSYTVSVTDANSCVSSPQTSFSFTITNPPAVSGVITPTQPQCPGGVGSASVVASGGTGSGYSYAWIPSGGSTATATGLASGSYSVLITDQNGCTASPTVTITAPAAFVTSISSTPATCHGSSTGTATVTISGGTTPYAYNWVGSSSSTNIAGGLSAGSISVSATDAHNCPIGPLSVTITEPGDLTLVSVSTDVTCNGAHDGTASITSVTGGTSPYTYAWVGGSSASSRSGLGPGTYAVTITDNSGCTKQTSFTIAEADAFHGLGIGNVVNAQCFGGTGSVVMQPIGGKSPYTYSWSAPIHSSSSSVSGLPIGLYSVSATDNCGAQQYATVSITQPNVLILFPQQTNVACYGTSSGRALVYAEGGTPPYTYAWSPSGGTGPAAHNLAAGIYTVTVTDSHGCTQAVTFIITEPAAFAITPSITQPLCKGDDSGAISLAVVGGTDRYVYQWVPSSAGAGASVSNIKAGTYSVVITDAEFCSQTKTYTVAEPTKLTITGTQVNVACHGGASGSATIVASGGSGSYTYSWSPSGGSTASATGLSAGTYIVTVTDAHGCIATRSFTINEPGALAIAPSQVNVACRGQSSGSAIAVVSGGSGGYTYAWAPAITTTTSTASGLAIGTYVVTVTDSNSCTTTHSYTITEPASVLAITSSSHVDVLCHGSSTGSATVAVSGGTAGYTYAWTPSGQTGATATGLVAGVHSVTVTDANGCTVSQSFTVLEPAAISIASSSQVDLLCHGASTGSATITATGGTGGFTYSWSPSGQTGATPTALTAGVHQATITDANSCTFVHSITIAQPTAITLASSNKVNVLCNGANTGSVSITATGGTPGYTYLWSPSSTTSATATGLLAGVHQVTITDLNSCTQVETFTIAEPAALALVVSQVNVSCHGGKSGSASVVASGGAGSYTYAWSNNAITATTPNIAAGEYNITVTDANQCIVGASIVVYEPAPLTAQGIVEDNVCHGEKGAEAAVSVAGGTAPYTYLWSTGGNVSEANKLGAGRYVVTVTDAGSCVRNVTINVTDPAPFCIHGACTGLKSCKCAKGWSGTDCSAPVCESPCLNGGVCAAPYTCSCPEGWTGPVCNISTNYTISTTYVIKLVQLYKKGANVSIPEYVSLLAAAMNIPVVNINVTQELYTIGNSKRAVPKTYTKLICTISLNKTGTSFNRTQEMVLEAANSTDVRNYLEANGSDSASNTCYIYTIELQTIYEGTPPKSSNNRKFRLGLGVGLGLGIPFIALIIVGAYYVSKRRRESRTPGEGVRM